MTKIQNKTGHSFIFELAKKQALLIFYFLPFIFYLLSVSHLVFAQEATATPRPTFGPTCTPTMPPPPAATPTLPVTAGSPTVTSLTFILGAIFLLGGLGASLLLTPAKKLK